MQYGDGVYSIQDKRMPQERKCRAYRKFYQAQANANNWRLMLSWLTGLQPSGTGKDLMTGPLPILLAWLV
ncbi:MAG: hypothetical protein EB125_02625, partial [Betaproteobacteria bacterium]|nr:hypothetical protein [Betaproteobacteria bacterium]